MITDRFDKEFGIVVADLSGRVSMAEILGWFGTITPERFPVKELKMLSDASSAEYTFNKEDLKESDQAMADITSRFKSVKIAIVHTKPRETAYSEIVRNKTLQNNYSQNIFSTRESALRWLLGDWIPG